MLQSSQYVKGDIVVLDRAYIDYEKFETLTKNGVTYVTKLKKNLIERSKEQPIQLSLFK